MTAPNRERLLAYRTNPRDDADPELQARIQEIGRDFEAALEKTGEALGALGFTVGEAGEFISNCIDTANWDDYFPYPRIG